MTFPLRIGTRRSKLALAQSGMMQRAIGRALGVPETEIETAVPLVEIVTTGDRVQDRRLLEIGGKALFTKEIEEALLAGRIDVAIHSMKDVPAEQPEGLCIAAIPEREDARDAFVSRDFDSFDALPFGARLGTASLRRQAQALALRPDLKVEMLRGNIDTRLRRAADGEFDAILLAVSGMTRLGVTDHIREKLSLDAFLPAPGQGALALQTRAADIDAERNAPWVAALNHAETALCVAAERGAMTALEGSCRTAVGAYARIDNDILHLTTEMLSPDGSARWRRVGELPQPDTAAARTLGQRLGGEVKDFAGDQEVDPADAGRMTGAAPLRVWITRAEPGAARTAARLRDMGLEPIVAPLLVVEPLTPALPDLAIFAALAFTSPNGVAAYAPLTPRRDHAVFAVGDATAQAASAAGFPDVRSAQGDLTALARLIAESLSDAALLIPQAETPAGDMTAALTQAGARRIVAHPLPIYRANPTAQPAPAAFDAVLITHPAPPDCWPTGTPPRCTAL